MKIVLFSYIKPRVWIEVILFFPTNLQWKHHLTKVMNNVVKVCVLYATVKAQPLSVTDIKSIKDYVIDGFDINNSDFPSAICSTCSNALCQKRKDETYNLLCLIDDYDPNRPQNLHSTSSCTCRIYNVAKIKLQDALKMKMKCGRKSSFSTSLTDKPKSFKICSNCFNKIYPGCSHPASSCHSRRAKVENLLRNPVTLQRVVSRTVKSSSSTPLSTLGPSPRPVAKPQPRRELFLTDNLFGIQQDLQLSTRQTLTLATDIRLAVGSQSH